MRDGESVSSFLLMMSNNDKPPKKMKDALWCALEAIIRQEGTPALNYRES